MYDINKNTNQRRDGDYELAHSDNILRKRFKEILDAKLTYDNIITRHRPLSTLTEQTQNPEIPIDLTRQFPNSSTDSAHNRLPEKVVQEEENPKTPPSAADHKETPLVMPSLQLQTCSKINEATIETLFGIKDVCKVGKPRGAPKGRRTTVAGIPLPKEEGNKRLLQQHQRAGGREVARGQRGSRGRSRGATQSWGPKKLDDDKVGGVAFDTKNNDTKLEMMLKWLLMSNYVKGRDFTSSKIKSSEIDTANLNDSFIDTRGDHLKLLMPCMEKDTFETFLVTLGMKRAKDDYKCAVCGGKHHQSCKNVIRCDGCYLWHHWVCVEIKRKPVGDWFCALCSMEK
ncbi:PREDICTED: uncharacterized protein LOC108368507 [Rhagoletis zephyria]|uniref:uncharacterized protein LOC108368507 n=1 Tax=Rhagoletis zephyria TaxID=28612 RepID=UPI0008119E04|nr:PREDICTED: uncharacterized protein LOC108368507 [Rhagoletis zephyria]